MLLSLDRWKPRHLLAAWTVWWTGLGVATLAEPLRLAWRITRPEGNHGNISASFENTMLKLTMSEQGRTLYESSAHFGTIALWIAGPPLVLWLLWMIAQARGRARVTPETSASSIGAMPSGAKPALGERKITSVDAVAERAREEQKIGVRARER
jgi:hypothetical protein